MKHYYKVLNISAEGRERLAGSAACEIGQALDEYDEAAKLAKEGETVILCDLNTNRIKKRYHYPTRAEVIEELKSDAAALRPYEKGQTMATIGIIKYTIRDLESYGRAIIPIYGNKKPLQFFQKRAGLDSFLFWLDDAAGVARIKL